MTAFRHSVHAALFSIFASTLASAQILLPPSETRFSVGGSFIVSQPKEGFAQAIGNGYGGSGGVLYHLTRSGLLGLRFDISGMQYGHETKRVPLSGTIGSRILVDVNTNNSITALSWGPELAKPSGRVRPYVNFGYSALFFRTTSSVQDFDSSDGGTINTTNFKDSTRGWVYGGGLRFQLGSRTSPVMLDTGLRYNRGGTASYLREGSIQDNPDGTITMTPLTSRTPFLVYTIGVKFRIPYDSNKPCARFLC
jgi:opacity protein-like surface antigen